ncbi:sulfotransferase [Neiella sp. HB171785]|uniref:Sulfotransferase n=1 Tax=Neiella litorisoli TaxID=2771431 RepID=A0A8J6QHK4_9GAMM|nr:sulfotransferase domain-containing protein [Neiella litorisoli]MBD1389795.1 sulfotransferase [Neiella litorisoli]
MASSKLLLTGIPRSGTTLSCKLLNERSDVVALHEPINPQLIATDASAQQAVDYIRSRIDFFDQSIVSGTPFSHGDKGGLGVDNPVGQTVRDGVRAVRSVRGEIQLPARPSKSFSLVVKQNALFTALLPQLLKHYQVVTIVRNPIDVLLSWMTVDLPVNTGHIPAGERFAPELASELAAESDVLQRQLIIYQWFSEQFATHDVPTVRYEDLIETSGTALDRALGLRVIERASLAPPPRKYPAEVVGRLVAVKQQLFKSLPNANYSQVEIENALNQAQQKIAEK